MPVEHWSFPARRDEVGPARRAALRFVREHGADETSLRDLALGISEMVTNAVLHAYRDTEPGEVGLTVELHLDDGRVLVVVRDDGRGLAPRSESPGAGLGLGIVDRVADSYAIGPAPGGRGTEVRMTFPVPFGRAGRGEPACAGVG